uniref:ubiquitinyl hydrolase 1 n=1 Tax=Anthurium amnicola TaxID=1678845 RepID=A0A1D1Y437_9ARAE
MPSIQEVLLGLPGALQLVLLLFVPVLALLARRKWRLAAARREEVRRLVLLAAEEAARAEIEATYEYRNRLDYEYSPPSAAPPPSTAKPVCAVCHTPTTNRCSRCKAVRYCSGKCQIIHWRQGHKEECHPPHMDSQPNTRESYSDLRTHQIESSNLCDSSSVTFDANSNQTTEEERPVSSTSSCFSTIISREGSLEAKHIVDTSGTECSSDSSSLSPSSSHSTLTASTEDGAFIHAAFVQDNPARCQETCAAVDASHSTTGEISEKQLNKSPPSKCSGAKSSVSNISLIKLNEKASNCRIEEVGCQIDSSLGQSFSDKDGLISQSVVDHAECKEPAFELRGDHYSGHSDSTLSEFATEEVSLHRHSGPAIQTPDSSCRVVPSHATISKQMPLFGDVPLENVVSKARDISTRGFDVPSSDFNSSDNTELCPRPRETRSVTLAASVDQKPSSSSSICCSVSSTMPSKVVNTSAAHTRLLGMTSSLSNGNYDLRTSVHRVVRQFKPLKGSKNSSQVRGSESTGKYNYKMLFPYDVFIKLYNEKVEMRPSGLENCGNSCYANVVLQCLAFTRPLTSYLLQGLHSKSCPKKEWCFTCEFERLVLKVKQGQSPLSPISIISQIPNIGSHLGRGKEEDAHEFLRYAIDAMQSVCLKEGGTDSSAQFAEETTLIQLIFGGYLRSKIKCMKCQNKSERSERMMDLTVEIDGNVRSLEEALARFTTTEILDGENKYQCNRCKTYEKAKKRLKILVAPNILTIALKRFQSGNFGKLNKAVRFPEFLNLAKYMSGTGDKSPIYRLYAVVVHLDIMNAAFSGHYVCYVMNASGKWYKIDDRTVKPVELERVLSKTAYMLFYARCSPRAPSLRNTMSHDNVKIKSKCQDPVSSVAHPRPQNYSNWTNGSSARTSTWDTFDTSDSSSIFSGSEEGSYSTESTRDSVSTDGLSEYIFGESGHWNSPMRFSEDSDGFTYSPLSSGCFPQTILNSHVLNSPESGYSASDFSSLGQEDSCRMRGLSYRDCLEEFDTVGVGQTQDCREVSMKCKDGISFLRSESSRHFRKLTEQCSGSFKGTDLTNPSNQKSVLSMRNTQDRTTQTFH